MRTEFKNRWVVVDQNNKPFLYSLAYQRKGAIENYVAGDERGWSYWRKSYNLKVIKVNVIIEPLTQ